MKITVKKRKLQSWKKLKKKTKGTLKRHYQNAIQFFQCKITDGVLHEDNYIGDT